MQRANQVTSVAFLALGIYVLVEAINLEYCVDSRSGARLLPFLAWFGARGPFLRMAY